MAEKPRSVTKTKTKFTPPDGFTPFPLTTESQKFFLYNIAHEEQSPKTSRPAIRILGAFEDRASAVSMIPQNSPISYFVSPLHKFIPITAKPATPEVASAIVAEISQIHEDILLQNDKDFEETVAEQRTGTTSRSVGAIRGAAKQTQRPRNIEVDNRNLCPPLTAASCLDGQRFVVITYLADLRLASLDGSEPPEPLFAVLWITNTVEDGEKYAKYTASTAYPRCTLDVVDCYKWLFPEDIKSDQIAREDFGNDDLDAIFKKRKANIQKISALESEHPDCVVYIDSENPKPFEDPMKELFESENPPTSHDRLECKEPGVDMVAGADRVDATDGADGVSATEVTQTDGVEFKDE